MPQKGTLFYLQDFFFFSTSWKKIKNSLKPKKVKKLKAIHIFLVVVFFFFSC